MKWTRTLLLLEPVASAAACLHPAVKHKIKTSGSDRRSSRSTLNLMFIFFCLCVNLALSQFSSYCLFSPTVPCGNVFIMLGNFLNDLTNTKHNFVDRNSNLLCMFFLLYFFFNFNKIIKLKRYQLFKLMIDILKIIYACFFLKLKINILTISVNLCIRIEFRIYQLVQYQFEYFKSRQQPKTNIKQLYKTNKLGKL